MADAESLSIELVKARAERQLVTVIGSLDDVVGVKAIRNNDRRYRVGVPFGTLGAYAQTPRLHSGTHGTRQPIVASEDVLQAFFEQHVDRCAQAAQQCGGGGIRGIALRVGLDQCPLMEKT